MKLLVAVNVFDHHNGIIDQNADGKNQREQRHTVERKAPCPRGEQGDGQGQHHCRTDNGGFPPTERKKHQRHHRERGKQQFFHQRLRLVVGRCAIVARHLYPHVIRNDGVAQRIYPFDDGAGNINGVFARFLGDGDGDGGIFPRLARRIGHTVPDVAHGRRRAVAHLRHILEEYGFALVHANHQGGDFVRIAQKLARFNAHLLVARNHFADGQPHIRGQNRLVQFGQGESHAIQTRRVNFHHHGAPGAANRGYFARAGHPFQVRFHAVGDALQVKGTAGIVFAIQGQRDNRHIINALGLDDGRERA